VLLNDVPAYAGVAAVDCYIGATEASLSRGMEYGGAHVIEDLVAGQSIKLSAHSYGTDCYPRKEIETTVSLKDMNQCFMFNPRNAYQNYSCATNTSSTIIRTYMGTLLPRCANATYATSGELSPLLKDPELRTVGIGTRVFFGGAQGYVAWAGTQSFPGVSENKDGSKMYSGATLAIIGDLKQMNANFIRAAVMDGYGISLYVGIGIPFPVLDEDLLRQLAVPNSELFTDVYDYSVPSRSRPVLRRVSYAELRSGEIELGGRKVPAAPLSSLRKAREIAELLKLQVREGSFLLTEAVAKLPSEPVKHVLEERMV